MSKAHQIQYFPLGWGIHGAECLVFVQRNALFGYNRKFEAALILDKQTLEKTREKQYKNTTLKTKMVRNNPGVNTLSEVVSDDFWQATTGTITSTFPRGNQDDSFYIMLQKYRYGDKEQHNEIMASLLASNMIDHRFELRSGQNQ